MDVLNGLTFEEARKRVTKSFRESVQNSPALSDDKITFDVFNLDGFSYVSSIPTIAVILAYGLALILVKFQHADLLVVVCIVTIVMLLNFIVVALYRQSEKKELAKSLHDILSAYESSCENMLSLSAAHETGSPLLTEPLIPPQLVLGVDDFKNKTYLSSGHSQVSIVHTYRDGQWMRLPVLLLAEGDIIALMGGDLTPGRCYEIERINAPPTSATATNTTEDGQFDTENENLFNKNNNTSWSVGRLMNAGEKVHIRNRQQFSQQKPAQHQQHSPTADSSNAEEPEEVVVQQPLHFGERHRSLAAESVEILGLCGDVRCFQLAETPIVAFLQSTTDPAHVSYNNCPISGVEGSGNGGSNGSGGHGSGNYSVVHTNNSNDKIQTPSLIRTIFYTIVVQEGFKVFILMFIVTTLATIIRAVLVNESSLGANSYHNLSYDDWVVSMLIPTATACIFFLPLALPLTLIMAEAMATADVLASAEVTLRPIPIHNKNTSTKEPNTYDPVVNTDTNPLLTSNTASKNNNSNKRKGSHDLDMAHGSGGSDNDDPEMEDEFMDEDIDERAEDIAEGISTQVRWSRYLGYLARVLWHRLLLGMHSPCQLTPCRCCASSSACSCAHNSNNNTTNNTSSDHEAYLPIPLARSRLLEVLGAVTMVCFVDDDVICEGYSVTEEIFLLMDNPQLGDNAHPSHKHKQSSADVHKTRSTDEAENNNTNNMLDNSSIKPTVAVKGIVLDLHANPEATGSRFENPQWWRYLPSLKPLGLNAMLTYAYTATSGTHDVMQRQASGGDSGHGISSVLSGLYGGGAGGNSGGSGNSNGSGGNGGSGGNNNSGGNGSTRHRSNTNTSHLPYPSAIQRSALHNTSTHTTHTIQERRSYSNTSEGEHAAHHEHHHTTHTHHITHTNHNTHPNHNTHTHTTHPHTHSQAYQQTERSLVRHIRHLLPLESLRELAEEIGFEQSDLSAFTRVLEVNVLAPGLENAHLLEDTHQWGQEESRRRGSLLPQLRGGVYKDFRDGSLQMMSLGDPSLVLNYCREYWDGSTRSITPLSSTDRAEVLSVYERWRLEDFEVVAFCYSPIPTAGLQPLLSKEDAFSQANVANFTRHTSASVSGANGNNGVGTVNSNGKSQVLNTATSFTAHRHPSVASPFVPAKHNTLFFVDPITTQDLHRIAQGITSKSRANGVKANTRMNAHHHTHHSHNSNTNNTNTNNNTSDVVEHEPTNTLTDSHTEQNNTTHNTNTNTDNREESLYDFYPETADAAPLSHTTQHTPNTQYTQNSNLSYVTANTGPVSPSHTTDNTNTSGVAIPRAASFTALSPTSLTTLSTNTNSATSINSGTNTTLTEEQRRAGQATPVKNPLYGSQDVDKTPPRAQDDIGINNQSPPQPRVKSGSVESPPRKIESSVKQSSVVGNNGSGVTCSGGTTTGARKTSRSDASYMVTNTSHTSHAAHHKHGQAITKSVSLDRVSEYHTHGTEHEESNTDFKHTDDDASEESLLLPLPLPGILKASTSDRDVRVKQHGGDKVVVIQTNTRVQSKKQPHSPVLLFPDDDDASSVTSSIITPTHSSGVSSQFIRASTVESSNPTRVSIQGIGVRFGVDSTSTTDSSPELGLNIDTEHSGADNNTSGGGLSRSHTFHVTHPSHTKISVSEKLNSGAGIAHIGSGVSSGGSLTPPLVPRNPFALTKSSTVNALTPPLRHHSSEYVQPQYRHHPHGAMYTHITSKQRQAQQVQRSHQQSRQLRRASTRQLWTQMRQQVFLGMAASSVPVRKDVPNTKEDLDSAGVRFVYFSAQNMKRSKPVAEKIGIPFDWNCAISLRELEGDTAQDPHRHISNYADWDVLAHMPHGIEAIKAHIQNVDNVPLLVSLFTDATPLSVRQMVEVFRDNGEVVLTIGGGYRSRNHAIYASSDVACSVSVLPGLGSTSTLPASEKELIEQFPVNSECSLCRADVLLSFRLIGLTTINLLQTPFREDLLQCSGSTSSGSKGCGCKCKSRHNNTSTDEHERPYVIDMPNNTTCSPSRSAGILRHNGTGVGGVGEGDSEGRAEHLRLSVLLEVIRKGRILLRNMHQALALFCVATLALSAWPIVSMLVPLSLPPSPPPALALLFQLIYVPALCLTLLQCGEPEGVMKNTPRKNQLLRRPRDVARFCWYLGLRSGYVLFSIALTGWLATASTMQSGEASFGESMWTFYYLRSSSDADLRALWLVQDLMSAQALLSIVSQALTLLVRGQTELAHFPWPWRLPEAYFYVSSLAVLVLHGCVLGIREEYRRLHFSAGFMHSYAHLDWFVWVAMFVLPVLGVLQGVWVNTDDQYHYKRYLQFLRLEFDTRLGMHSPR